MSSAIGCVLAQPVDVQVSDVSVAILVWTWIVIAAALFRERVSWRSR
jgi:hypothetical protein